MIPFEAGRSIGRSFYLASLVPALVLVFGLWVIWSTGAFDDEPSVAKAGESITSLGLVAVAWLIVVSIVVGLALHPFNTYLIKLAEGYLPSTFLWEPVNDYGLARHHRRRAALVHRLSVLRQAEQIAKGTVDPVPAKILENTAPVRQHPEWRSHVQRQREQAEADLAALPRPHRVMPTRLGNVLRSAEDLAGTEYGMPSVLGVRYLFPLLPIHVADRIDDARNALEQAVRMSATYALLSLAAIVAFFDDWPWVLLALGFFGLGVASYLGATRTADTYGRLLVTATDLFRYRLFDSLRYPRPASSERERELFSLMFAQLQRQRHKSPIYYSDRAGGDN